MKADRRQFNVGLTSALLGLSAGSKPYAQNSEDHPPVVSRTARVPYFFKNPTLEIIFLTSLGRAMAKSLDATTRLYLSFRMRPFGFSSYYDTYKATFEYNLTDVAGQIRLPDPYHGASQRSLLAGTIATTVRSGDCAQEAGPLRKRWSRPAL